MKKIRRCHCRVSCHLGYEIITGRKKSLTVKQKYSNSPQIQWNIRNCRTFHCHSFDLEVSKRTGWQLRVSNSLLAQGLLANWKTVPTQTNISGSQLLTPEISWSLEPWSVFPLMWSKHFFACLKRHASLPKKLLPSRQHTHCLVGATPFAYYIAMRK